MIYLCDTVCRACELIWGVGRYYQDKFKEFKELYEILTVVDVLWKGSFKRLYEMGGIV